MAIACAEPTATPLVSPTAMVHQAAPPTSSYTVSATDRTMRVRLVTPSVGDEPPRAFLHRMFASADSAGATHMIIDLRGVEGGDARLVVPLVRGVVARERFTHAGALEVVVSDRSFTQSQSAATLLARYAQPRFVGASLR